MNKKTYWVLLLLANALCAGLEFSYNLVWLGAFNAFAAGVAFIMAIAAE